MNSKNTIQIRPVDLRGILEYVPLFSDHTFVICIDGQIASNNNFYNMITDIAVLCKLNINVVIVHCLDNDYVYENQGDFSSLKKNIAINEKMLEKAKASSAKINQKIIEAFTKNSIKCANGNCIIAKELGIINGEDMLFSGKVSKIEISFIKKFFDMKIVPVISPIACDKSGKVLVLDAELLAAKVAVDLAASKLIFLTDCQGVEVESKKIVNMTLEQLDELLDKKKITQEDKVYSKAKSASYALSSGQTKRVHILDARKFGALLNEVFDKVGVGTMIHSNDYQRIRQARGDEIRTIWEITQRAVESESLKSRTFDDIKKDINDYYIYEIDASVIGCFKLAKLSQTDYEIASLLVQPFYHGKGVGKKMVSYAEDLAKQKGGENLIALSTQSYNFFKYSCQFEDSNVDILSKERQKEYFSNGRNSKVLLKKI